MSARRFWFLALVAVLAATWPAATSYGVPKRFRRPSATR